MQKRFHPDEIRATKISSRLNKGNKDLTGQVGQAGQAGFTGFGGSFFACGEAPFGRRPLYPVNPVDPV